jgi:methionyl-tRNA formyltransferase
MRPLRLLFFGTPEFAVPSLRELLSAGHAVVGVVTQPDRPRGRGQKTSASPVKAFAASRGLQVFQPDRLKDEAVVSQLGSLAPDLGIVAAYGKILPPSILAVPRLGLINVHASLLPRWRGAAPVHRAVMAGDAETGVSIMRVVQALDEGGVYSVARRPIGGDETSEEVEADLAELGARLLAPVVEALAGGTAVDRPQETAGVTYAPRLSRGDGLIGWTGPAAAIHNQVRGLHPWPHAWTFLSGTRVIILRSAVSGDDPDVPAAVRPGEITRIGPSALLVAAGDGRPLRLLRLQAEGRRAVTAREFAAGARLAVGDWFGG